MGSLVVISLLANLERKREIRLLFQGWKRIFDHLKKRNNIYAKIIVISIITLKALISIILVV